MRGLAALVALTACATGGRAPEAPSSAAAAQPAPGEAPEGPVAVDLRVLSRDASGEREVAPGGTLRSGDEVSMEIAVDRPAWIYAVQYFPDGSSQVTLAGERVAPGRAARVPATGWFVLDDQVGREDVYLVSSPAPLAEASRTVESIVGDVRPGEARPQEVRSEEGPVALAGARPDGEARPDALSAAPGRARARREPPPNRLGLGTRGFVPVDSPGAGAAEEWHDETGVVVRRFSFDHAAR